MSPSILDEHPLLLAPVMQMVGAFPLSILWVVGDTWVRCDEGNFSIGADESATFDQVRDLLLDAKGDDYPWEEY
ncbi:MULTISPECIES: hypothetical protein [Pseudomonas]|jgi:hypothetical protein|uniref:Uncharacterized protein n=1 Tax=Pseudomonas fluorescens TaxID=294 RepID=A0A5E6RLN3_PSEFL|nr:MULTISPECIES: hypothetical protein [Pseudomonas]MCF5725334.1 hypothetical protein [Pseudomonas syringae]VVM69309.1 hypothetical protein PS673_01691 [Pseudomonas fluorescens]